MEDPTNEPQGEQTDDAPKSALAGLLMGVLGAHEANKVHEGNVHGSVIEQTVGLLETYMKPEPVTLEEPETGVIAPGYIDKDGLHVLPAAQFDDYRSAPKRRKGTAAMLDLSSFIGHVNRFADEHTIVFANNDRVSPSLIAVLDYHEQGAAGSPRFGHHRTQFKFPVSDQWKVWNENNASPMKMVEFAAFLENHIIDVMPADYVIFPEDGSDDEAKRFVDMLGGKSRLADPAKLMELAAGFQVHENSVVSEASKLSSGEGKIVLQNEHTTMTGQGEVFTVPTMFALAIPVFVNGASYRIFARLRYRKTGSGIVFWYELWRTDRVFDHAFDESVEKVQNETGKTVWLGSPE